MKTYLHPFPRNTIKSQGFGVRPGGYNPPGGHTGEDSAVPVGTPVHAAGDGRIDAARYFPNYNNEWLYGPQGGLTIVLDCGDAEPSFGYSHLSHSFVVPGQWVKKGQVIALSGNTGTATTGAHCHTEALPPYWNTYNGTYGRVDPRRYMTEFPGEKPGTEKGAPDLDAEQDRRLTEIYNRVLGRDIQRYFHPGNLEVREHPFPGAIPARSSDIHDVISTNNLIVSQTNRILDAVAKIPGVDAATIAGLREQLAAELKQATADLSIELTVKKDGS